MESDKNILTFESLYYEVKNKDKKINTDYVRIINGLSGSIESGKLTAVMGASGCGKTHFFDLIIGTIESNAKTSGKILYNGKERVWEEWTKKIAFLPQDDVYAPDLTVMESLMHSLSFDSSKDYKEKEAIANEALKASLIYEKRNAQIKTLSGGERKRAMIAMTLIDRPEILILDEPTTGLDSNSALSIVSSLKKYAEENNKIVILTVHQPGEGIFNLFSELIFLTKGGLFYMGAINKIKDFLIQNKLEISDRVSLAEFLFLLHSNESNNFINTYQTQPIIDDIIHKNADRNTGVVEVSSCNNDKVFHNSLNIKHSFILFKHNLLLLFRSSSLMSSLLLYGIFSLCFCGFSYLGSINTLKELCVNDNFIEDLPKLTFWDKFFFGYLLFDNYFLTEMIAYGILFSIDRTEKRMFDLQIFSGKYSAISYIFYQFIEKFIVSMIFLTIDFILNIILLRNSSIPISVFAILYLIIMIFLALFIITFLMIRSLPIGSKMSYFLLCSNSFAYFWPSVETRSIFRLSYTGMLGERITNRIFDLQYIFPHINYNMILESSSRKFVKELKDRSINIFYKLIYWLKFKGVFKETSIEILKRVVGDKVFEDDFGYQLYGIKPNHNQMKMVFPLSILLSLSVILLIYRCLKVPNVRTKLSRD